MKMISKLEFGEHSETFRALATQFYVQNVQPKSRREDEAQARNRNVAN